MPASDPMYPQNSRLRGRSDQMMCLLLLGTAVLLVLDVGHKAALGYLAWQFYVTGHLLYLGLTLGFSYFAALVITVQSVRMCSHDTTAEALQPNQQSWYERWLMHESWWVRWPWRIWVFITHLSAFSSYLVSISVAIRSLKSKKQQSNQRRRSNPITPQRQRDISRATSEALMVQPATEDDELVDTADAACTADDLQQMMAARADEQSTCLKLSECLSENVMQLLLLLSIVLSPQSSDTDKEHIGEDNGLRTSQLVAIAVLSLGLLVHLFIYLRRATLSSLEQSTNRNVRCGHVTLNGASHICIAASRVLLLGAVISVSFWWPLGAVLFHWTAMLVFLLQSRPVVFSVAKAWAYCWLLLPDLKLQTSPQDPDRNVRLYSTLLYVFYALAACILLGIYFSEDLANGDVTPLMLLTPGCIAAYMLTIGIIFQYSYFNMTYLVRRVSCVKRPDEECGEVTCEQAAVEEDNPNAEEPAEEFQSTTGGKMVDSERSEPAPPPVPQQGFQGPLSRGKFVFVPQKCAADEEHQGAANGVCTNPDYSQPSTSNSPAPHKLEQPVHRSNTC